MSEQLTTRRSILKVSGATLGATSISVGTASAETKPVTSAFLVDTTLKYQEAGTFPDFHWNSVSGYKYLESDHAIQIGDRFPTPWRKTLVNSESVVVSRRIDGLENYRPLTPGLRAIPDPARQVPLGGPRLKTPPARDAVLRREDGDIKVSTAHGSGTIPARSKSEIEGTSVEVETENKVKTVRPTLIITNLGHVDIVKKAD